MKKIFTILFFASIITNSCKKESLTDNFAVLIGEWQCEFVSQSSGILQADKNGFKHILIFEQDGTYKITEKQDGKKDEKGRVVDTGYNNYGEKTIKLKNCFQRYKYLNGSYSFGISTITGEEYLQLDGYINFPNDVTNGDVHYKRIK